MQENMIQTCQKLMPMAISQKMKKQNQAKKLSMSGEKCKTQVLFSNQIFIGKRTVMWGKCTSF
jgi:hypothetical protein